MKLQISYTEKKKQKKLWKPLKHYLQAVHLVILSLLQIWIKILLKNGINILDALVTLKLAPSKSEARRLVTQGGIKVNDVKIDSIEHKITLNDFTENKLLIQKGKKVFHQIEIN